MNVAKAFLCVALLVTATEDAFAQSMSSPRRPRDVTQRLLDAVPAPTELEPLWTEYLGDWRLIHRSEADLRHLCAQAGFGDAAVSATFERTRLAAIVTCQAA